MTDTPAALAVLGLGPMGRALATAALAAGHRTVVWNRPPGPAAQPAAHGAVVAPTVAGAAARAPVLVACLLNYAAPRGCVAAPDGTAGTTLVNLGSGHAGEA